jgi:hypothetical protein
MKQALTLTIFLIVCSLTYSRNIPDPAFVVKTENNFHDSLTSKIPSVDEMLSVIMNATGLYGDFELKQARVLNIEASISHKKRYILYNTSFIDWINRVTNDRWAVMTLIAHEIGHHLNGHTIKKTGSTPELELEADEFAGFVMYKLGASLKQAQEVMIYIAKIETSSTHPGRAQRIDAIQKGWEKAKLITDN